MIQNGQENPEVYSARDDTSATFQNSLINDVMSLTKCSWRYEVDYDEERIPRKLIRAVRNHRFCYKGTCHPLKTPVQTLNKSCDRSSGVFQYEEKITEIPVGYHCVPSIKARRGNRLRKVFLKMGV